MFLHMPKAKAIPAIETRDAIGVDVNYREVVVVRSPEDSLRLPTRIEDAAHVRRHVEALQRRRGRSWKRQDKILARLRRLRRRFRNILLDAVRKIGKAVAEYALAKKAEIWMEDLSGPKKRVQEASEGWRLRLTFLAYRRMRFWIAHQARKWGVPVEYRQRHIVEVSGGRPRAG